MELKVNQLFGNTTTQRIGCELKNEEYYTINFLFRVVKWVLVQENLELKNPLSLAFYR